jgi:hypothetical protein
MKKHLLLGTALLISLAQTATATPFTYTLTGTFTDIRTSGAGVAYGTTFVATYRHDESAQIGSLIESGRTRFIGGLPLIAYRCTRRQVLRASASNES